MQEVFERTHGKLRLWPATLYGTLRRMTEDGLIEESGNRPEPDEDDPRRKYYRLTSFGRDVLAAETARLEELVQAAHARRLENTL